MAHLQPQNMRVLDNDDFYLDQEYRGSNEEREAKKKHAQYVAEEIARQAAVAAQAAQVAAQAATEAAEKTQAGVKILIGNTQAGGYGPMELPGGGLSADLAIQLLDGGKKSKGRKSKGRRVRSKGRRVRSKGRRVKSRIK